MPILWLWYYMIASQTIATSVWGGEQGKAYSAFLCIVFHSCFWIWNSLNKTSLQRNKLEGWRSSEHFHLRRSWFGSSVLFSAVPRHFLHCIFAHGRPGRGHLSSSVGHCSQELSLTQRARSPFPPFSLHPTHPKCSQPWISRVLS